MMFSSCVKDWTALVGLLGGLLLFGKFVHGSTSDKPDFPFTTVVDILSENAEFSKFLRILQRQGSVPYLNDLQNFTLLAPVNSAFVDIDTESYGLPIEVQNYIMQGCVLPTSMIAHGITIIDEAIRSPVVVERSRVKEDAIWVNKAMIVDPDLTPNFQNATVHGISGLLNDPPSFIDLVQNLEYHSGKFSLFKQFTESISDKNSFRNSLTNNTVLIPSDNNFQRYFNHLEINYILDYFNNLDNLTQDIGKNWQNDRLSFWRNIISQGIIGGMNVSLKSTTNLNGERLVFKSNEYGSAISVNNSAPSFHSNLLFTRGIAHTFNDIEFLANSIRFNAEKYLHGMNSSDFVQELYFRKLQKLINDEGLDKPMTIFVPETSLSEKFGFAKSNLLYHFSERQLWLEKEFSNGKTLNKMFPSAFCSANKGLGGNCQLLKVTKNPDGYAINDKYKILHNKPFEIGQTLIYTISEALQLPGDFVSSLNPFYHCSKSLTLLRQINLLDFPLNKKGYTVLLPCFDAWDFHDLNFDYLKGNNTAVELMMKNLILEGLIYTDSETYQTKTTNLLQEEVSVYFEAENRGNEISLNLSSVDGSIQLEKNLDVLFKQGVIHPLLHSYFPRELNISLIDLIETTGTAAFIDFLNKFEDTSLILRNNEQYSFLVPAKNTLSMEGINMNFTKLHDWLGLHVVPGYATNNLLDCSNEQINTTSGEPLVCRESSPGNYVLKLKNGNDNEVRILKKGCSSFHNNSCVFLIDRPISLHWLSPERYHLKLPGVAVGIGIVVGAISVLALLFCILVMFVGKNHTERQLEETNNASDASRALLHDDNADSNSLAGSNDHQEQRFESSYSSNSSRKPINVSKSRAFVKPV